VRGPAPPSAHVRQGAGRPLPGGLASRGALDGLARRRRAQLVNDPLSGVLELLAGVRDLERLIARIDSGRGNARDVKALAVSLLPVPSMRDGVGQAENLLLREVAKRLHALPELVDLIHAAIADTPAVGLKDGGIIRPGYSAELDELRNLASEGHAWLANYQASEQERTGIKTLKVRHNKVFGFYIEVSKGQAGAVPPEYERRQTLVGAERFITPELKTYEQKIFGRRRSFARTS